MKKIIPFLFICLSFSGFAQKGYRYSVVPGTDNTFLMTSKEAKVIPYAATATVIPTQEQTTYNFNQLTGAISVYANVTKSYTGDRMTVIFHADGSNRTVTFSTGFTSNGTLTVTASTYSSALFVFDGVAWYEQTRSTMTSSVSSLAIDYLTEKTAGGDITIQKQVINQRTATTYTATGTYTVQATELSGGLLVAATSTATATMTLPTATAIGTQLNAVAGTTFDFVVDNAFASNGTVTVAVNTGIVASGFPGTNTLTLAGSATIGIAVFRLTFISATAATLTRIS